MLDVVPHPLPAFALRPAPCRVALGRLDARRDDRGETTDELVATHPELFEAEQAALCRAADRVIRADVAWLFEVETRACAGR